MKSILRLFLCAMLLNCALSANVLAQSEDPPKTGAVQELPKKKMSSRIKPTGETGKRFVEERKKTTSKSAYSSWKRRLPFWPRKLYLLLELGVFITLGV